MTIPKLLLALQTDALRAVLRPWSIVPRPIPCPQTSATTVIGGER
jgi:hypothetical protein